MKRTCPYFFLLLCSIVHFCEKLEAQTWVTLNTGSAFSTKAMCFPTIDTGYILSGDGYARKTTNGGNSWQTLNHPGLLFTDMKFLNVDTGYFAGDSTYMGEHWGLLYQTINGGTTWIRILATYERYIEKISLANDTTIYIVTDMTTVDSVSLWKSVDMGTSWVVNRTDSLFSSGIALLFNSTDTGYYTVNQSIYSTFDGGISWQQRYIIAGTQGYNNFCFPTIDTGYVVGMNFLLKTTNAGLSWSQSSIPSTVGYDIYFIDGAFGFIAIQNPTIHGDIDITSDGGQAWLPQFTANEVFYDLEFPCDSIGYAAGTTGEILKYYAGTVGISELSSALNFTLFPNPAKESITLKDVPLHADIRLLDASGKLLLNEKADASEVTLDTHTYAAGIYFVEVSDGKNVTRKKVVLQ